MSDGSRERVKGGKPGQMNEVKEGAFVMVLGHVNDKEVLRATRIDLRLLRQRFSRFNGPGPSGDAAAFEILRMQARAPDREPFSTTS